MSNNLDLNTVSIFTLQLKKLKYFIEGSYSKYYIQTIKKIIKTLTI